MMDRRGFMKVAAGGLACAALTSRPVVAAGYPRLGMDVNVRMRPEDAIPFAAENGHGYIQVMLDLDPTALASMSDERCGRIRELVEQHNVILSMHSLSAVNTGAIEAFVADAVDEYLKAYVDRATCMGAQWVVVHGGYHFHAVQAMRKHASIDRIKRVADYAGNNGVRLLLENHNREPDNAEVHYMPWPVDECNEFFDALPRETVGWSFNVDHANLTEDGVEGFLDQLPVDRLGEIRLADNDGTRENDVPPGEGNIDIPGMIHSLESKNYSGPYLLTFGEPTEMLKYRDPIVNLIDGAHAQ